MARATGGLSRLAGTGGGTTVPGKLLWKLDPSAVDELARRLRALAEQNGRADVVPLTTHLEAEFDRDGRRHGSSRRNAATMARRLK